MINTTDQKIISKLFICQCNGTEHQLIFSYFPDDKEVYVSVHLIPDRFLKRPINAIKYIFGYEPKYGDFEEFIFRNENADKLQLVVNYLRS